MLNTFVSGVILTVTELSMQIRYSVLEWFFLMYDHITIFYNSGKNMIYCFWILSTFGVVSLVVLGFLYMSTEQKWVDHYTLIHLERKKTNSKCVWFCNIWFEEKHHISDYPKSAFKLYRWKISRKSDLSPVNLSWMVIGILQLV